MNKRLLTLLALGLPTCFLLGFWSCPVFAQNTITFTAEVTVGVETVTPVLTWSTSPVASDCFASGDWFGSKGPFGTETLSPITNGATYNLMCEWLASESVTLSWTAPTQNTDGSPLTDLAGFNIKYGTTPGGPYPNEVSISNPSITTFVVSPLTSGNWFFVATAFNALGVESDFSNEALKILGTITVQESVGIVVNPKPNVPTGLDAQ